MTDSRPPTDDRNAAQGSTLPFPTIDTAFPDATVPELFVAQCVRTPQAVALRCGPAALSYAELDQRANQLAHRLVAMGVGRNQPVALLCTRSLGMMVALLGIQKAGGYYVPIDPEYPPERIAFILSDCRPLVVVTQSTARARLGDCELPLVDLDADAEKLAALPTGAPVTGLEPGDFIYAIYTSGSTGKPKGALNYQASEVNLTHWYARDFGMGPHTRFLIIASIGFDQQQKSVLTPLLVGGLVDLLDSQVFDPLLIRERIAAQGITSLNCTPSAFYALIENGDADTWRELASLTQVFLGGEMIAKSRLKPWLDNPLCRAEVINTYGPTECTDTQTYHRIAAAEYAHEAPVPIGVAVPNCQLYVLDEALKPVAIGEKGQLWLGGICVGGGYLNLPERTAQSFLPNPWRAGERMYATGDIVAWRPDGVMDCFGRVDDQVKVRGHRIELGEVEAALAVHPELLEVAVTAPVDSGGERVLAAYVRLAPGAVADAKTLRRWLESRLPEALLPSAWTFMAQFPRTASGKLDRKALPAPGAAALLAGSEVSGMTLADKLAAKWRTLLSVATVGHDERFFEIGGTSLKAVQFVGQLSRALGIRIPITAFFKAPTIAEFATWLQADHADAVAAWLGSASVAAPPATPAVVDSPKIVPLSPRPSTSETAIAIVGLAVRVPGANDVDTFWSNLVGGVESLRLLDADELAAAGVKPTPGFVPVSGWIDHADCFDHGFFGVAPREAELMDPQQRVLLETAWSALEHAGIAVDRLQQRVGVFTGVGPNSYFAHNLATHEEHRRYGFGYSTLGNDKDYSATRIAFKLGLRGPAVAVQTACSSSGVAIHLACLSIKAGDCELALAGAASLPWLFQHGHDYVDDGPLTRDGHVRAFDAAASGMALTAGAAMVVLKRLDLALADGDTIHAVVRATALNNDGGDKIAYTAPSVNGQAEVIGEALARAGVPVESIGYVEAHGTGTQIGDPIEVAALTQAWRRHTATTGFCAIGSVKSNIGHLDAAAAAASVVKTVLALRQGQLPASLHFDSANPECDFASSPFVVNAQTRPWPAASHPRRAAVSSFGFGGTNFHGIFEQAPERQATAAKRPWQLLKLSAKTPTALQAQAAQLAAAPALDGATALADAAYTLEIGRSRFAERGFVVARSADEARRLLGGESFVTGSPAHPQPSLVFLFPGQGAQHVGMGEQLFKTETVFRNTLRECAEVLQPVLGLDLCALLYPPEGVDREASTAALRNTQLAQPAIFAVSLACARLWQQRGLAPVAMLGHSVGEFVAATLAGVFTLEHALLILAERGRLMQSMPAGGMLAVRLPEAAVQAHLGDGIALAAINAPQLSVLSGPLPALQALRQRLEAQGVVCRPLHTSHAFHSEMMQPVVAPFAAVVARYPRQAPRLPFYSSLTGKLITADEAQSADYWAAQLRGTVRFAPALAAITAIPGRVFVEAGPGQNLSTSARQCFGQTAQAVAIASLPHANAADADDAAHFNTALGRLYLAGIEPDPQLAFAGETRLKLALPGYPFARIRHWIDARTLAAAPAATDAALPAAEGESAASAAATESPQQIALARTRQVFADVSGIQIAAGDDQRSFLELGFDSLLLTQVTAKLKNEFKVALRFRQMLEDLSSLAALSAYLAEHGSAAAGEPAANRSAGGSVGVADVGAAAEGAPKKAFGAMTRISKTSSDQLSPGQRAALDATIARYTARTGQSKRYAEQHRAHLADPRTVSGFKPLLKELVYPLVTPRSEGGYVWDLDGHRYVDITSGFGCIFFGHRPPWLTEALKAQLDEGFEIGPQHPLAGECARYVAEFTGLPRVAFCNTGSEAVMAAMRVARTVTGRNLIVMHNGDYHGMFDEVIVRGTAALRSLPAAPGIPNESVANTLMLDYGDPKSLEIMRSRADEIAAVIIEPVQSRRADLQPREYLHGVRAFCDESGAAMVMDEVITGFRCAIGGAQQWFEVKGDMGTYGKVIGGGLPIGVLAGIPRFMDALDGGHWQFGDTSVPEVGVTYFAGTFVRHPLVLAAVKAVSLHMKANPGLQDEINARTVKLVARLESDLVAAGAPLHIANFSSLFKPEWRAEQRYGELFFVYLREAGVHLFDGRNCFLTAAHTDEDCDRIVEAFRYATSQMLAGGFFDQPAGAAVDHLFATHGRSPYEPPLPGARVGRDADGNPAWFVADPSRPGHFLQIDHKPDARTLTGAAA